MSESGPRSVVHHDIDHILTTTRTVRRRLDLDRAVDRQLVEECVALALQAPSGANRQDWRFMAIDDPAAKGAIVSMTRHMAMEGRSVGIRANSVSPGLIETHQTRPLLNDSSWSGPMLDKIMLGRVGQPEEIASAALFFASDESSYATGADLLVDGGMTAW